MAHLWTSDPVGAEGWALMPLDANTTVLDGSMTLLRRITPEGDIWVLIAPLSARVNGAPLDAGIRVLRDRDELRVDGHRRFFSTETLATVASFPGGDRAVFCPRCKLQIAPESAAVRCPRCGVWHHQSEELPCWTYAERCTLCDQSSRLDAGFGWTPEDL